VAIHYPDILQERIPPHTFSYDRKAVMLYALGIGLGEDPLNEQELAFVYERNLKVVPTSVTVLASAMPGPKSRTQIFETPPGVRASSFDRTMSVHGEQKVVLHQPLPGRGTFTSESRTVSVLDKGAGKGAVIARETTWIDNSGELVATLVTSIFARGDGGFGGPSQDGPAPQNPVPTRSPDASVDIATRPGQALLYRLNGDRNPLHADPPWARRAGFPRPILHGLCTYGVTCRAVMQAFTDFEPEPIYSHEARFSAPVMPGDVITVDLWRDGQEITFEAAVKARGVTVVKNGRTLLR
jgi:acyl dehydratase